MPLDFKSLVDSFALKQTFLWAPFKDLWIASGFCSLNDILKKMGRNRSETIPYVIYLKQCYCSVLNGLNGESDPFAQTGWIYCLYSLYETQLGKLPQEDDEMSLPVVSIPISLFCLDLVIVFAQRMKEEGPDGKDGLTAISTLFREGAFLPCFRLVSYENPQQKKSEFPEQLTSSYLKDTLRIDEFETLEAEYNHLVHHDPESSVSSVIADLLQELPTEVTTQETVKSVSKPRAVTVKRIQHQKILERSDKIQRKTSPVCSNSTSCQT